MQFEVLSQSDQEYTANHPDYDFEFICTKKAEFTLDEDCKDEGSSYVVIDVRQKTQPEPFHQPTTFDELFQQLEHQSSDIQEHDYYKATEDSSQAEVFDDLGFSATDHMQEENAIFCKDEQPPATQARVDTETTPEQEIRDLFSNLYLRNQIKVHHEIPVLQKFLPLLFETQVQLKPQSMCQTDNISLSALTLKEKRPTQLVNKVNSLIARSLVRGDLQSTAAEYNLSEKDAAIIFKGGDIKEKGRKAILSSNKLSEEIFQLSFFKSLLKQLNHQTNSDIDTNLLSKLVPLAKASDTELEDFMKSVCEEDGEGTKLKRTFKKPFTVQENIVAIVTYLKEFIYEIKLIAKLRIHSNEDVYAKLSGSTKTQFGVILSLLNHFESLLVEENLIAEWSTYPKNKERNIVGFKNLDFQSFVWITNN